METISRPMVSNAPSGKARISKIGYWTLTGLFALAMLMDGIAGVVQEETGKEVMRHLGYPMNLLIICGIAKILGVVAILQTRFRTIKEWAYAGFAINFIGAFASRAFVGDGADLLIPPVVMLAVLFLTYYVGKRYEQIKAV
ncbi:hypothetical protein BN8_02310 [Fibrisoma limi BUZ 3]|uniref:DoxX family protein n=1 Tax=Fibrisoma limi BUZ 3 TaxID=1185876 RepID=I2GH57_9BACT|nr:DoxX family protein [Fibrisoma limi]CCH53232.1 hypothetical protein BN8_02310 [Fibrisoma limi BUZ 3]